MDVIRVVDALGGEKIVGRAIRQSSDLSQLVRDGLPIGAVVALAERLGIMRSALSENLGIPRRTLTRRISNHARLTAAESDRAVRLARIYALATDSIGESEKARLWLQTPNRALAGERPLDLLDTDPGARDVEDLLGRIAYGVYS